MISHIYLGLNDTNLTHHSDAITSTMASQNYQPHNCLFNRLFRRRSKKTSMPRVTGLCEGNSPVTGEFPTQRASNTENVSIWWHYHAKNKGYAMWTIHSLFHVISRNICSVPWPFVSEEPIWLPRYRWLLRTCLSYWSNNDNIITWTHFPHCLCMHPANGRRCYIVTSSPIGLVHTHNVPSPGRRLVLNRWAPANRLGCRHWIFLVINDMHKNLWRTPGSELFVNCAHGKFFFFLLEKFISLIILTWFQMCGRKSTPLLRWIQPLLLLLMKLQDFRQEPTQAAR